MACVRKGQTSTTIKWLDENYCSRSNVCLPREMIYDHYLDFCLKNNIDPMGKATFGKIIRRRFPKVISKRLGTRGHSKYHYHGIGMKQNSLNNTINSVKGWTRFSGSISKSEVSQLQRLNIKDRTKKIQKGKESDLNSTFSLSSKVGTVLPEFPNVNELKISEEIDENLLQVFLTMYKIHCQCIVDTAVTGNLDQIEIFLLHFWHGLPDHLSPIMNAYLVEDIIVNCDWILYKTLLRILFPTSIQKIPDTLLNAIHSLGCNWMKWLKNSMENFSSSLQEKKMKIGKLFSKSLRRHVAVFHTAQILRPSLCIGTVAALCDNFYDINNWIINVIMYATHTECEKQTLWCINVIKNLQMQLQSNPSIDNLIEAMESIINKEIIEKSLQEDFDTLSFTRNFVLKWNYLFSRLCQWLTLKTSDNFVAFHLLLTFLREYQLLMVETLQEQQQEEEMISQMQRLLKTRNSMTEPSGCSAACIFEKDKLVDERTENRNENFPQKHVKRRQKKHHKFKRNSLSEIIKHSTPRIALNAQPDTSMHLMHIKAMNDNLRPGVQDTNKHENLVSDHYGHQEASTNKDKSIDCNQEYIITSYDQYSVNGQGPHMDQEWPSCAFEASKRNCNENSFSIPVPNWSQCNHCEDTYFTQDQTANRVNNNHHLEMNSQHFDSFINGASIFLEPIITEREQEENHTMQLLESYLSGQNSALDVTTNDCNLGLSIMESFQQIYSTN